MMNETEVEIFVCKFYDPYCISIITKEDFKSRENLNDKLNETKVQTTPCKQTQVGEIIAVKYGQKIRRARVENIIKTEENKETKYICWLLDYGLLVQTQEVFHCINELKYIEGCAKRAVLYGIIPVQLKYNHAQKIFEKVLPTEWSNAVCESVWPAVDKPNVRFFFKIKCSLNKMLVGELMSAKPEGKLQSFNKLLCDSGCAIFDESMFKERMLKLHGSFGANVSPVTSPMNVSMSDRNDHFAKAHPGRGRFSVHTSYEKQMFENYDILDGSANVATTSQNRKSDSKKNVSEIPVNFVTELSDCLNTPGSDFDESHNLSVKPSFLEEVSADGRNLSDMSYENNRTKAKELLDLRRSKKIGKTSVNTPVTKEHEDINFAKDTNNEMFVSKDDTLNEIFGEGDGKQKQTKHVPDNQNVDIETELKFEITIDDSNIFPSNSNKSKNISKNESFIEQCLPNCESSSDNTNEKIHNKVKELSNLRRAKERMPVPAHTNETQSCKDMNSINFTKTTNSEIFGSMDRGCYKKRIADAHSEIFSESNDAQKEAKCDRIDTSTNILFTSDSKNRDYEKYSEAQLIFEIKIEDDINTSKKDFSKTKNISENETYSGKIATSNKNSSDNSNEKNRTQNRELLNLKRAKKIGTIPISITEEKEHKDINVMISTGEINNKISTPKGRGRFRNSVADSLTELRQFYPKDSSLESTRKLVPEDTVINQAPISTSEPRNIVSVKIQEDLSNIVSYCTKYEKCSNNHDNVITNESQQWPNTSEENVSSRYCLTSGQIVKCGPCNTCMCAACLECKTKNDIYEDSEKPASVQKNKLNPELLFKRTEENHFDSYYVMKKEICGASDTKQNKTVLFIHGQFFPKPVSSLLDLPFHAKIQEALKKFKYENPYHVQVYGWPAIMSRHHVFLVNEPQTGKTMTYIPALASFVAQYEEDLPAKMGPIAMVVCPEATVAEEVHRSFLRIWPNIYQRITLLTRPLLPSVKEQQPHIIIGTLPVLVEAIHDKFIRLNRLCHVVLEEASELYRKYPFDMKDFLKNLESTLLSRTYNTSIQLILVSQIWCHPVEKLMENLAVMPIVCIGSCLEAAIYGRVNMKLHFLQLTDKVDNLIKTTSKYYKRSKLIILCNNLKDVGDYCQKIKKLGIDCISIGETSTTNTIMDVYKKWSSCSPENCFVLVCEEEILNSHIYITDATVMVQYSLPDTWCKFTDRLSVFLDTYSTRPQQDNENKCTMYIYVDETNSEHFTKVVSLLLRLNVSLSPRLLNMFQNGILIYDNEKNHRKVPICENKIMFGECPKFESCEARHNFYRETDIFPSMPQSGLVKLKLLRASSPSKYWAYIIQHTNADGQMHNLEHNLESITNLIKDMSQEILAAPLLNVDTGIFCIYKDNSGIFWRCEIVKLVHMTKDKNPAIILKLLDKAEKKEVSINSLYSLPTKLATIPPLCVKVILANIAPADNDLKYSANVVDIFMNKLKSIEYNVEGTYATAIIRLALRSIIWVTNITIKEDIRESEVLLKMSVVKSLLANNLAVSNLEHLKKLYNTCRKAEIPLDIYKLPPITCKESNERKINPTWAHLETPDEYHEVYFAAATNPGEFYVKLTKFRSVLDQLMKDINDSIKQEKWPKPIIVQKGCYYLAKCVEDEMYGRVLITELNGNNATCFFVDFGDFQITKISELKFLSDEFLQRLPFQVIECHLWGIKSKMEWPDEAMDILYNYAFEPHTDVVRNLYVKVIEIHQSILTLRKYSVILVDIFKTDTIINNIFVEKGFAESVNNISIEFEKIHSLYDIKNSDEIEDESVENENSYGNDLDKEEERWQDYGDFTTYIPKPLIEAMLSQCMLDSVMERKVSSGERKLPTFKVLPPSDYLIPTTVWKQNDTQVILRIQLMDVKDYKVYLVRNKIFSFRATVNSKLYGLDLNLFKKVKSEREDMTSGLQVIVKLNKEEKGEWERLTSTNIRNHHITYEIDEVSDTEDSVEYPNLPSSRSDSCSFESEMEYKSD